MNQAASTVETVCFTCNQAIQGKILTALGRNYHPEHFTCAVCEQPITGTKFQENDGKPYCEKDYYELFSRKCHACNKPIKEKVIKALGYDWHEEHFICTVCKKILTGQTFFEKNGNPYCKEDFNEKFADKCALCMLPITDKAIVALNEKWHQDCFRCDKCSNPIVEDSFTVENDKPICQKCSP